MTQLASTKHMHLRIFSPDEIIISDHDARAILIWFYPHAKQRLSKEHMHHNYKNLAQSMLIIAIDTSYKAMYIKAAYDAAYLRTPLSVRKVAIKFGRKAAINWFKNAKPKDLRVGNVRVLDIVRRGIAFQCAHAFRMVSDDIPLVHRLTPDVQRKSA